SRAGEDGGGEERRRGEAVTGRDRRAEGDVCCRVAYAGLRVIGRAEHRVEPRPLAADEESASSVGEPRARSDPGRRGRGVLEDDEAPDVVRLGVSAALVG